jgi:hypothetical protein
MEEMGQAKRRYARQRTEIQRLFLQSEAVLDSKEDDEREERLAELIDTALDNPFLPRLYRAEYLAIRALYVYDTKPYIQAAEEVMASFVGV